MQILPYTIDRYDDVIALMRATPGVSIRDADSREATARYLARNPGLSVLCVDGDDVVGCAMCGHDGRRGYLQHVVVAPDHRRRGIAAALVERCLAQLQALGIDKAHIDVFGDNDAANAWWTRRGWTLREDIHRYSMTRSGRDDA